MKIIALGDSHFVEGPRFAECVRVHKWIVDYVRETEPDLVVHAGDLVDRRSTPAERLAVAEFVMGATEECPLIACRGNHDPEKELSILSELRTEYPVQVVDTANVIPIYLGGTIGGSIGVLAWPTHASAADQGEAIRNVLRGLGSRMAEYPGPRVLLAHLMVSGAKTGAGQPLIGGAVDVPLADLALAQAHAVVLGHVHAAQEWGNVYYTGSPFRTSFGESETKSILELDIDEIGKVTATRIQTPAREMLLVSGTFDGAEWGGDVCLFLHKVDYTQGGGTTADCGPDIRFRYEVAVEHREAARAQAAEKRDQWLAHGAASVKIEEQVLATTRAREGAAEIAAAVTLKDQLVALWASQGVVPSEGTKARLFSKLALLDS